MRLPERAPTKEATMLITMLGLRVKDEALEEDGVVNAIAESLPTSDKRVATKVQLTQKSDHYVGKLLKGLKGDQTILAIGPAKATPDGVLQMQPMLVVTNDNFDDLLAINTYMACGGLGPKQEESDVGGSTVTNRSLAWQDPESSETSWTKITAWDKFSKQLSELPNGTPTIAVGRITTSEKEERQYLNYSVEKVLYLPKGTKSAPNKAADPDKGRVSAAALGSLDFSL